MTNEQTRQLLVPLDPIRVPLFLRTLGSYPLNAQTPARPKIIPVSQPSHNSLYPNQTVCLVQIHPPYHHIPPVERGRIPDLLLKLLLVVLEKPPALLRPLRAVDLLLGQQADQADADLVADQVVPVGREVDVVVPVLFAVGLGQGEVGDGGVEVVDVAVLRGGGGGFG